MSAFVPTLITVRPVGANVPVLGPLVSVTALWTMTSGEQYEATVPRLSTYAACSLVPLLCRGQIGPLALLALGTDV